jgi:hypothetical protein
MADWSQITVEVVRSRFAPGADPDSDFPGKIGAYRENGEERGVGYRD